MDLLDQRRAADRLVGDDKDAPVVLRVSRRPAETGAGSLAPPLEEPPDHERAEHEEDREADPRAEDQARSDNQREVPNREKQEAVGSRLAAQRIRHLSTLLP